MLSTDPLSPSPVRLLEQLDGRFGAFRALAHASLLLARCPDPDFCPPLDLPTAHAMLAFGEDLRAACHAACAGSPHG